jgi:hypothetical protein
MPSSSRIVITTGPTNFQIVVMYTLKSTPRRYLMRRAQSEMPKSQVIATNCI